MTDAHLSRCQIGVGLLDLPVFGFGSAHQVALPAAALQFLLAHPIVTSVIPGAASPEQVRQNIASVNAPIPAAFWADLKTQSLIDPESPVPQ